ncbi:hypothetical protein JZO76_07325 [Enterococcus sp. MJM12]|uniref:Phage protein n=1 Tax=Candidatus Enterococcus myersii TaxID=2815322 RepID=A0ABS3H7C2_9ENTE|nr:hypothetical protein [Enterococcus sp. MJM12]MBO0449349.1 hypothetical protein [Enterococcus sp. MJM12]
MKYRKKPIEVEAIQLRMASARRYRKCKEFVGESWIDYDENPNFEGPLKEKLSVPAIKTLEGIMNVNDGDYIIKGVQGELYPCKPDIFEATYEEV